MLARLGLPAETLIKIRRVLPIGAAAAKEAEGSSQQDLFWRKDVDGGHCRDAANSGTTPAKPNRGRGNTPVSVKPLPTAGGHRKRLGDAWSDSKEAGSPLSFARRKASGGSPSAVGFSDTDRGWGLSAEEVSVMSTPEQRKAIMMGAPAPFTTSLERHAPDDGAGNRSRDISPVSPTEAIRVGDILFLGCPRSAMIKFQGFVISERIEGLDVLDADVLHLGTQGASFLELVISDRNDFIGRRPYGRESALLASHYSCRIVAVRHARSTASRRSAEVDAELPRDREIIFPRWGKKGKYVAVKEEAVVNGFGNGSLGSASDSQGLVGNAAVLSDYGNDEDWGREVARRPLAPGDTMLVLAHEGFAKKWKDSQEFDLVSWVAVVPTPVRVFDYLSLLVFCGMLGWVLFAGVVMVSGLANAEQNEKNGRASNQSINQ